jgi:large subunit ribosomal protein L17
MRHRKYGRKFSMTSAPRKAMFRNLVTSILLHGRIKTTEDRAKEIRAYVERVISLGKRAPSLDGLEGETLKAAQAARVHAIRLAKLWVNDRDAVSKVFGEYAARFATRPGGYTRVLKAGRRQGDNASLAWIELVGELPASSESEATA